MYVFPSLDSGYKTRKRAFKSCRKCRSRRIKCVITSVDYATVRCDNCRERQVCCDLTTNKSANSDTAKEKKSLPVVSNVEAQPQSQQPIDDPTLHTNQPFFSFSSAQSHQRPQSLLGKQQSTLQQTALLTYEHMKFITADYLKQEFNFKSWSSKTPSYTSLSASGGMSKISPSLELDNESFDQLLDIYFYKVNSIFPKVNEGDFWETFKNNKVPSIIIYSIVLIAEPILKRVFKTNSSQKFNDELIDFINNLELKLRQILSILPELGDNDKLSRLIYSLLLTLHFSFNKFGNEQSSHDLTDSINYALSLTIHLQICHDKLIKDDGRETSTYLKNLWWMCFIFDRFNAIMNSKAMSIKRSDFNIEFPYDNNNLLKLVNLTIKLKIVALAIYSPKGGSHMKIDFDQYIEDVFVVCDNEEKITKVFAFPRVQSTKYYLPNISVESYSNATFFNR